MAPKGGGGSRGSAKKDPFESDAKNLRQSMVMKEINWGIAFDFLKATYPEKTTEEIDAVLGGGGTYDAETDEWSYHGAAEKYGEMPKEETEEAAPSWAAEEEEK